MKQIICILALLLMSVTTTKAQTSPATPSIRGKILTEEKQPIEFANIALLSEDSTFIQGTCRRPPRFPTKGRKVGDKRTANPASILE